MINLNEMSLIVQLECWVLENITQLHHMSLLSQIHGVIPCSGSIEENLP